MTDYDAVLKELWPQERIDNLAFSQTPFLAIIKKRTDFTEKLRHIALQYGNPQGRSATFANAQGNVSASLFSDWQINRATDYAVGVISGELLESSKDKKASIVSALDTEIKGSLTELSRSLHKSLFGDGSGTLGPLSTTASIATPTATLANVEDISKFAVGMTVVAAATPTGAIRVGGAARALITAVDRDAGTVTTTANWNALFTTLAAGDYLFVEGDAQNGGSAKKVMGLAGWLPTTTPTSTPFFGVDRTADPVSLAGVRYDGSADGTKTEALQRAAARIMREGNGATPTVVIMNPVDLGDLLVELGSQKVFYSEVKAMSVKGKEMAAIGFDVVAVHTSAGAVKVLGDYECPLGLAYMLDMETWTFHSLLGAPRVVSDDGLNILRAASSDGFEYRAVYRGQLACTAPGRNAVVTLP